MEEYKRRKEWTNKQEQKRVKERKKWDEKKEKERDTGTTEEERSREQFHKAIP